MVETRLRQITHERRLTRFVPFRAEYMRMARSLGLGHVEISQRQFERWMNGQLTGLPRQDARQILEAMFGEPPEALFGPPATHHQQSASPAQPQQDAPATAGQPMDLATLMDTAARRSRETASRAGHALSSVLLEQVNEDVRRLAKGYMHRPPIELTTEIIELRERVFSWLEQTRRPDQLRELHVAAGILTGLLSQTAIDLGLWGLAADHALAAWGFADSVGHGGLAAWARGMQATVRFWSGRTDALMLIARAQDHAPVDAMAVRIHSLAARAWSYQGRIEETVRAIRAAEEVSATGEWDDLSDGIGGLFLWGDARREMCAGSAYAQLLTVLCGEIGPSRAQRLADQVVVHARRALDASQNGTARSRTLETSMLVDQAAAAITLGDHHTAQEALHQVWELPAQHRTYPLLHRLGLARLALANLPRTPPWARELNGQILTFTSRALPPAPTLRALPGQLLAL